MTQLTKHLHKAGKVTKIWSDVQLVSLELLMLLGADGWVRVLALLPVQVEALTTTWLGLEKDRSLD